MNIVCKELSYMSASGLCNIYARRFTDSDNAVPKAVVQITHGMAEHTNRYVDFAQHLCAQGFAVYMHDHLGHGRSVSGNSELGFFGETDGWLNLVEDVKSLTDIAKKDFPDTKLVLFGHSMGSFVAREYCEKYGSEIDGAVICGTSGSNPGAAIGLKIADFTAKRNGSHFNSEFINSLAFSSYNKRIKPARTPFDWLTRDDAVVDDYIADPLCGYLFTAAGYRDLFTLLVAISKRTWYANIPYSLPIFLIAGEQDPVGAYGKGVKEVARKLRDTSHTNVSVKLYPECRHELLNELCKDDVYSDVTDWILNIAKETV